MIKTIFQVFERVDVAAFYCYKYGLMTSSSKFFKPSVELVDSSEMA
jgi:hypothetical protein